MDFLNGRIFKRTSSTKRNFIVTNDLISETHGCSLPAGKFQYKKSFSKYVGELDLTNGNSTTLNTKENFQEKKLSPFSFGSNLKALYGLFPSSFPSSRISLISCIFLKAQRNRVFHVEGSGWSPLRYFPVWKAQRLNSSAWPGSNSGLSTRTHGTLKIPSSLLIHSKPSISPFSIWSCSQGVNLCLGFFVTLRE